MKKTLSLVLVLIVVCTIALPTGSAEAVGTSLTASASLNQSTKVVTIQGTISSGSDKEVFVTVTNPDHGIDYADQTKSGLNGAYSFSYVLSGTRNGTYTVNVGGTDVNTPQTANFTFSTDSNPPIHPTDVQLDKKSLTFTKGGAAQKLNATVNPANATNKSVTWSSGNMKVATVDNTGLVTPVGAGRATITVTTADGGKTATCQVKVKKHSDESNGDHGGDQDGGRA